MTPLITLIIFKYCPCIVLKRGEKQNASPPGQTAGSLADTVDGTGGRKRNPYPRRRRAPTGQATSQRKGAAWRIGVDGKTDMPLDNKASTGCTSTICNATMHSPVSRVAEFVEKAACSDANGRERGGTSSNILEPTM